jgi:hypothetical protein
MARFEQFLPKGFNVKEREEGKGMSTIIFHKKYVELITIPTDRRIVCVALLLRI